MLEILMKNILKPLLLLSAMLFFSSQAATDPGYFKGVGAKLGHGVALNAITGVREVPRNMLYETNDNLNANLFVRLSFYKKGAQASFLFALSKINDQCG
jgi:hypothetical protein